MNEMVLHKGTFVTGRGDDCTLNGQKLQLVDLVTSAKDAEDC